MISIKVYGKIVYENKNFWKDNSISETHLLYVICWYSFDCVNFDILKLLYFYLNAVKLITIVTFFYNL